MTINLSNYIESILNPIGRFKLLEGIYGLCDTEGEPLMMLSGTTANFETVFGSERHILKCFLNRNPELAERLKEISVFTKHIDCRHLTPFVYYENEMLIFNNSNEVEYTDIVLQKKPDGRRLDNFLFEASGKPDAKAMLNLIRGFHDVAEWLAVNDFSHNNICSKNIYVTEAGYPVLVNYEYGSRCNSPKDIQDLGVIAAAVYTAACQPELYPQIIHGKIIKQHSLKKLSLLLSDIMCEESADELKALLAISGSDGEISVEELCRVMGKLSECGLKSFSALENIAAHVKGEHLEPGTDNSMRKYSFIGEMQDMMMRVCDSGMWFYIDKTGNVVIPGYFLSATDFSEGRAVVETEEGYGMINLGGGYVIEPRYEDIDWDNINNVAIVTVDGYSGLFNRDGKPITGLIYDQILSGSEGLFPVKKNGKFGYICKDGSVAIEPVFDDAFGFRNGLARIRIGKRELLINKDGVRVEEIRRKPEKIAAGQ